MRGSSTSPPTKTLTAESSPWTSILLFSIWRQREWGGWGRCELFWDRVGGGVVGGMSVFNYGDMTSSWWPRRGSLYRCRKSRGHALQVWVKRVKEFVKQSGKFGEWSLSATGDRQIDLCRIKAKWYLFSQPFHNPCLQGRIAECFRIE